MKIKTPALQFKFVVETGIRIPAASVDFFATNHRIPALLVINFV
jgi:hypothetical protein